MQMSGITSHMRNDLSKKFVYLFHSRTKSFRIEMFGVVGETRTQAIHNLVFLFDERKDI